MIIKTSELDETYDYGDFFPALDKFLAQYGLVSTTVVGKEQAEHAASQAAQFVGKHSNTLDPTIRQACSHIYNLIDCIPSEELDIQLPPVPTAATITTGLTPENIRAQRSPPTIQSPGAELTAKIAGLVGPELHDELAECRDPSYNYNYDHK